MKIAVSGKGGVGKSVVCASLALLSAERGNRVLAIDADPDANLASALGFSAEQQRRIVTIAEQAKLIEERTGARPGQYGQMFKMNPEVSDIADKYAVTVRNVSLLELGAAAAGGGGCACPENVMIRSLITDLVLRRDETVVLDMEAGVEHLGRATASGVDVLLIVVEPGQASLDCAERIVRMAGQIGLSRIEFVANKITAPEDRQFVADSLKDYSVNGWIPFSGSIRAADRHGESVIEAMNAGIRNEFERILASLGEAEEEVKS